MDTKSSESRLQPSDGAVEQNLESHRQINDRQQEQRLLNEAHLEKQLNDLHSDVFSRKFWISWRMAVTMSAFAAVSLHSVMRAVLGMTLVCMVNRTAVVKQSSNTTPGNISTDECWFSAEETDDYDGRFVWNSEETNAIISALGWGHLFTVIPAGMYADKYSAKKLLFLALLIAAILTFVTPFVAELGFIAMIVLRFGIGLTGGVLWPCINALVARWCPTGERSTLYGIITSGNQISVVLLMPISAAFCRQRHILGGWPLAYYVPGVISIILSVAWLLLVSDDPLEHKRIGKEELLYITVSRKSTSGHHDKHQRKRLKLPWKRILCSRPSLALLFCMTSAAWGILLLLNYLPTYFRDVLYLNLSTNGIYTGLPFLFQFIFKIFFSRLADYLRKRNCCSHDFIVRGFNTLGMVTLAGFMFAVTFVPCTRAGLAVAFLCAGAGLYSAVTPGFLASSVIIAPKYAGIIAAYINFFANVGAVFLPFLVTAVVTEQGNASQWRIVVGVGAAAQLFAAGVFLFWGGAEEQEWAKSSYLRYEPESEKRDGSDKDVLDKDGLVSPANCTDSDVIVIDKKRKTDTDETKGSKSAV